MSTPTAPAPFGARRRLSAFFYRHRWLKLLGLLIPPLGWMVVVYLAALVVLLATAFWQQDELSGQIIHTFTWDNVRTVKDDPTLHAVTRQTVQMAVLVTITDILLAFPLAYYMARVASRGIARAAVRGRADAAVVELPDQGLHVAADDRRRRHHQLGAGQDRPGAAAHRVHRPPPCGWPSPTSGCPTWCCPSTPRWSGSPDSLIEASSDLGGRSWRTLRSVIMPLALPGIAAGSIFTFSLTLGDYIMVDLVGGNKTDFLGSVIFRYQGIANDLPLAAAIALVPVAVITIYLLLVRQLGAFEAL